MQVMVHEKRRFTELFLRLRIPSLLMGEVLCETEPFALRWERYLFIGCKCLGDRVNVNALCGALILKIVVCDRPLAHRILGRLSQRCAHGTTISFCPVRTFCLSRADKARLEAVGERCETIEKQLPFPCAYALKAALQITFDVVDQMMLLPAVMFDALLEQLSERSRVNPVAVERALSHIVASIDAGNVVRFTNAFDAVYSTFKDEKPPQLARGTCMVRSVFITPGRVIFRPAQVSATLVNLLTQALSLMLVCCCIVSGAMPFYCPLQQSPDKTICRIW